MPSANAFSTISCPVGQKFARSRKSCSHSLAAAPSTLTCVSSVTSRLAHSLATRLAGRMVRRSRLRRCPCMSVYASLYQSALPLYQSYQAWM